nr:MAG TPA: hypothetical protein [Caudoviricetes sp.]
MPFQKKRMDSVLLVFILCSSCCVVCSPCQGNEFTFLDGVELVRPTPQRRRGCSAFAGLVDPVQQANKKRRQGGGAGGGDDVGKDGHRAAASFLARKSLVFLQNSFACSRVIRSSQHRPSGVQTAYWYASVYRMTSLLICLILLPFMVFSFPPGFGHEKSAPGKSPGALFVFCPAFFRGCCSGGGGVLLRLFRRGGLFRGHRLAVRQVEGHREAAAQGGGDGGQG